MNKRGQTLALSITSALLIFIVGFLVLNFLTGEITSARNQLNCANPTAITDGTKLLCLAIDATVPYWIWLVLSIAIGAVIGRLAL